jgi:hypothetical protein
MQRILAGKLPKKKVAFAVVGNPAPHPPYVVLLCQQRINLGPKKAKAWMDANPMPGTEGPPYQSEYLTLIELLKDGYGPYKRGMNLQCGSENEPRGQGWFDMTLTVWGEGVYAEIADIKSQQVDIGIPLDATSDEVFEFCSAWSEVIGEILEIARTGMMPQDFFPTGSKSVWKLKGRDEESFEKALRAKSRLGKWL